jgi:hypothetical protein
MSHWRNYLRPGLQDLQEHLYSFYQKLCMGMPLRQLPFLPTRQDLTSGGDALYENGYNLAGTFDSVRRSNMLEVFKNTSA